MSDDVKAAAERLLKEPFSAEAYDWWFASKEDVETVARAALKAGQEVARYRTALERILRDTRIFIFAAESPAETVPFYEISAIAKGALDGVPYVNPDDICPTPGEPESSGGG